MTSKMSLCAQHQIDFPNLDNYYNWWAAGPKPSYFVKDHLELSSVLRTMVLDNNEHCNDKLLVTVMTFQLTHVSFSLLCLVKNHEGNVVYTGKINVNVRRK